MDCASSVHALLSEFCMDYSHGRRCERPRKRGRALTYEEKWMVQHVFRTSDSFLKMDMRSAHAESRSRRHVFETNTNEFALILQLHCTQPIDHLAQEASIR